LSPTPVPADPPSPQCVALSTEWKEPLRAFLAALEASGDDQRFRPHPFTAEAIDQLVGRHGEDIYCLLVDRGTVLGYGMLRGWDEGYEVPSLGIAIHPAARGRGLGRLLMELLHGMARQRGAQRVRLRVREDNSAAIRLYSELGYRFSSREQQYLVGFIDLQ
jgi:ribosomal-protein-alanine N-acetyltransferase